MSKTFFFYDLETSGLDPRNDRIMQFAGIRTDLDLNPIGDPYNLLVKLPDDILPSPYAINVTKITPQSTLDGGMPEPEFAKFLAEQVFAPDTIVVGYNNIRFDDEFIRHLFWRNFYDPYEWQWSEGRSRWDLLDVVRLTRALRGEGINWPVDQEGKATNRLELLTKLNNLEHAKAHDALSDVYALIAVTKLIKTKQPKLFDFLLNIRDKKSVTKLINLENPQPFVYASGRYASEYNKTTVAFPLAPGKNNNILVYDLRYNLEELLKSPPKDKHGNETFYPIVKELAPNKTPAVAPLGVLDQDDGWQKISLTPEAIQANLQSLINHPEFAEKIREQNEKARDFPPATTVEAQLYDSFLPDADKPKLAQVRTAGVDTLADLHPNFIDERLPELLLHYKGRNFPSSLSAEEAKIWQSYRAETLERRLPAFLKDLETLYADQNADRFILDELQLYAESVMM